MAPTLVAWTSTRKGRDTATPLVQQREYQLIREPGSISERTFAIAFEAPGAEAFCFTFG
jgi:hypothetical protein